MSSLDRILNTPIHVLTLYPMAMTDPAATNDKLKVRELNALGPRQIKALMKMEPFQTLFDLVQAERLRIERYRTNSKVQFQYPEPMIFVDEPGEDTIWNAEWWLLSLDRYLENFNFPADRLDIRLRIAHEYLDEEPREWLEQQGDKFTSLHHFYHEFLKAFGSGPEPYYKRGSIWPPPFSLN